MADYIYKEEQKGEGMSPITVAFLGALAGAVGTGVAMALSNPKNRQKVQRTMQDGQHWMDKTMKGLKSTASDMKSTVDDTAEKFGKAATKSMDDMKETPETRRSSMR